MNHIDRLIDLALEEDIANGDITTQFLIDAQDQCTAHITAKESLVFVGLDIAKKVFHRLDPQVEFVSHVKEGEEVLAETKLITLTGRTQSLLTGERVALNFLQRLSGIATNTKTYIKLLGKTNTKLVDTRKTIPGWRQLEKYAVRMGGGYNHRIGLYDGILIKDNHVDAAGGILPAVQKARKRASQFIKIEVETRNLKEVQEAIDAKADIIMLDNMTVDEIKKAVQLIQNRSKIEISGGVTKENIKELASLGADFISSGALTHAAKSVDINMTFLSSF